MSTSHEKAVAVSRHATLKLLCLSGAVIASGPVSAPHLSADVELPSNVSAAIEREPGLKPIIDAWRTRMERCGMVQLTYTTSFIHKGPYNEVPEGTEVRRSTRTTVTMDGARMKYEFSGQFLREGRITDASDFVSSYDGSRSATLFSPDSEFSYAHGFVYGGDYCDDVANFDTQPITWAFAAFDPEVAHLPIDDLKYTGETRDVDGHDCHVLEVVMPIPPGAVLVGGNITRYLVDPLQGYSIRRYTVGTEESNAIQLDCSYVQQDNGAWIPQEWTTWRFGTSDIPFEVAHARVDATKIGIDQGEVAFSITFPPGTIVSDYRKSPESSGRTGSYDYLVRSDGSERRITWEERFASYERLQQTESGEAARPEVRTSFQGLLVFNLVAAAVIVFLVLMRHLHRRRENGPSRERTAA